MSHKTKLGEAPVKCKDNSEVKLVATEDPPESLANGPSESPQNAPAQVNPVSEERSLSSLLAAEAGPIARERAIEIIINACRSLNQTLAPHGRLSPAAIHVWEKNEVTLVPPESCPSEPSIYSAKELAENAADARADVYSLGVILYEMLSNKNNSAAQHEIGKDNLANWLAYSPSWAHQPTVLKNIIRRSLNADAAQRYQTIQELENELESFLRPKRTPPARTSRKPLISAVIALLMMVAAYLAYLAYQKSSPLSAAEVAAIGKYEVVMLVDKSGSMSYPLEADPFDSRLMYSQRDPKLSRWTWVSAAAQKFAAQTQACLPTGFNLITFSDYLHPYGRCSETQLSEVMKNEVPYGGTRLAPALQQALEFRNGITKPLAILVITDGAPYDAAAVQQTLVEATKTGNEHVKIVFLNIGTLPNDRHAISSLTEHLASYGAKYEPVSSVSFEELKNIGFSHAIARAVEAEKAPK